MKSLKYFLPVALLALAACNDDDVKYVEEGEPIAVVEAPAESGIAASTTQLKFSFSAPIEIVNPEMIEMDGAVIANQVSAEESALYVSLTGPLAIDYDQTHTLTIYRHAVKAVEGSRFLAEPYTFTFSTESWIRPDQKSKVASAPANANATAEAKALYGKLLSLYGEKQLSGAMGAVAWDTEYSDLIASATGKQPAVIGFDYIHLASSKAGANWINYADITPVKKVWEAGSVPAISWHWNVPSSISESLNETLFNEEKVIPGDWSGFIQLNDEASMAVYAKLGVGAKIKVATKDVAAGAQGSFKDGSSWGGLVDDNGVSYDYFNIDGDFEIVLDAATLAAVQSNGLIISGHDYTITGVTVEQLGAPSTDLSFRSEGFSVRKALTPGTVENSIIEQDIADVASYLKLLQDAGIPVLWRPLHESAGDYVWGAWFWWGMEGPAATLELWDYLYNKLTNEYGLNNLLWVWTLDYNEAGALASVATMKTSYPGPDKCDFVGADIYADDPFTSQIELFNRFLQVTEGKKMLTLSEVGNLIEVDQAYKNGALWSYCMQWYDMDDSGAFGFNRYNQASTWSAYMNNEKVLNQGEF